MFAITRFRKPPLVSAISKYNHLKILHKSEGNQIENCSLISGH